MIVKVLDQVCWTMLTSLLLFGCSGLLTFALDDPNTSPPVTVVTATPVMPTLAPGIKTNYTVKLSYTGPAVLDSVLNFTARLYDYYGHQAHSKLFFYQWTNNANLSYEKSWGDYQSSVNETFSSQTINRGQYLMTVTVYDIYSEKVKKMLAFANIPFVLTDKLNGQLGLNQSLPYQRNKTVFSTGKNIHLKLNLTDNFDDSARYQYMWYVNKTWQRYTSEPKYDLILHKEGNHTIEVVVTVMFENNPLFKKNNIPHQRYLKNSCENNKNADKCGQFVHHIVAKKPLTILRIDGSTNVAVNGMLVLNISCLGSSPTGVCWNTTKLNKKHMNESYKCVPKTFINRNCFHQIAIKPSEKGWHDVQLSVYNDVSYLTGHYFVFAYNTDVNGSHLLTIPIVFSLLVTVIIVIGGAYLWKLRKKPYIEVADFEFHPSISRNDSYVTFPEILGRLRQYMPGYKNDVSDRLVNSNSQDTQQRGNLYETL